MKYCIIGGGFIAALHACACSSLPGITLCGVADIRSEAAGKIAEQYGCAAYTDAREMLKALAPDAVSICVPTFLHAEMTCLAAEYGAHILCEKPLALTMAECEDMRRAAEKSGVSLMAAQVVRWWPEYAAVAEMMRSGRLGSIRGLTAVRIMSASRGGWYSDPKKSGGTLFDILTHDIDYMVSLFGTDIDTLYAIGKKDESGGWRHIRVLLRYLEGLQAQIEAGNDMPAAFPFVSSFRLDGERGSAWTSAETSVNIARGAAIKSNVFLAAGGKLQEIPMPEYPDGVQEEAFRRELKAFTEGIQSGGMPIPLSQTMDVMRLLHWVRRSLEGEGEISDVARKLKKEAVHT